MAADVLTPKDESEAATMIRSAAEASRSLRIEGGGSKAGLGRDVHADQILSTRALTGIVAYNPAEMVMSARAGTPLAEIEAALAGSRQMLAFEPVDLGNVLGNRAEPTIGGVFATNLSGPRRLVAGAARDSLIGVRLVNGAGEIVKSGGRVMKNVTGLDIVKLMAGSYGTLGLMSEVTFKVLPRPERAVTILLAGPDETHAASLMARVMATSLEVSGAAYLPESCRGRFLHGAFKDGGVLAFRIEGLGFSVAERAGKLVGLLAAEGIIDRLEDDETRMLWQEIRDAKPFQSHREKPLWRVSVAPAAGASLINRLRLETGVDGYLDWQGGLLWLQMEAEPEADILRGLIKANGGGHATLIRARPLQKAENPVFEPQSPAVEALSRRIREKFDRRGIFNPGLMG